MLTVTSIEKSFGTRTLFSGLSFTVMPGDRIGIVGRNGCGKTTLLEIMAGMGSVDEGVVSLRRGATMGYLEQSLAFDSRRPLVNEVVSGVVDTGRLDHKRALLHDDLASETDPDVQAALLAELGELESHYEHVGAYTVEYQAKKILAGLGFDDDDHARPMAEFSGGWLMRAGLARLLLTEPDILYLDEPTNHLDLEAVIWLEQFLTAYPGAVVVISHDRTFLNNTVNRVIAIEGGTAKLYRGTYDAFLVQQERELEILAATAKNQDRFIETQKKFIERFRAKNTKAKQVQSRIRRLDRMERVTVAGGESSLRLRIPPSPRSGRTVVDLKGVTFGYEGDPLYKNLGLTLVRGDKTALVGPNGAGKTTLLKILAGRLQLDAGTRDLGHNVTPVFYAQHQAEELVPEYTVLQELRRAAVSESDERLRTVLGSFLFSGDSVEKKVSVLSGGEKARLSLAKLFLRPANFILMDEPTNHLDIPSRDVLVDALSSYDGTLCLVTHDRDLIGRTATSIVEVGGGEAVHYPGTYADYVWKKGRMQAEGEGEASAQATPAAGGSRSEESASREADRDRKRREAELRNRVHRETKSKKSRMSTVERETAVVEGRMTTIEARLADPASFPDRATFEAALADYNTLNDRKAVLEEEWLALSEQIDAIRAGITGAGD